METKVNKENDLREKVLENRLKSIKENREKLFGVSGDRATDFHDNIFHRLKTPLHTILSSANLLKKKNNNPEAVPLIEAVESSGLQLLEVLGELFPGEFDFEMDFRKSPHNLPLEDINDVLVVDDNMINLKIAGMILENKGFRVDLAKNGKEAVEKTLSGHYDLILMDLQMPVMDGFEAAALIRDEEKRGTLGYSPVILALSANENSKAKKASVAAGMDGFLSKPFKWEKLPEIFNQIG